MTHWQRFLARLLPANLVHLLACGLLLAFTPNTARSQPALQVGSQIRQVINPAESQSHEFALKQDQLIELTLSAGDLSLRIRIMSPEGNSLAEVIHRRSGRITWSFIAPQAATYQLVISSPEQGTPGREYQLQVNRIQAATGHDKKAVLAANDFNRAEVLRLQAENSELSRAIEDYQAAAAAWVRQRRWSNAAEAWQQIGEVHLSRGNYAEASRAFDRALQLSQRAGDLAQTITQESNLGYVYVYLGDLDKASHLFDRCQHKLGRLAETDPSRERLEAQLQNNYGEVVYGRGNLKASFDFFARALARWEKIDDRRGIALAHLNFGHSYFDSGRINEAAREFDQALGLWRELRELRGEALTLTARGNIHSLLGDNYAALTAHREAREIFRRIGDRQGEAVTSNGMGQVFYDLNSKPEAIDEYSLALKLNQALGNKDFEAVSAYYLGQVWLEMGNLPRALEYYQSSLSLSKQAGKSRMATLALMDIATIYLKQQKVDEALAIYRQALDFYKSIADLRRQAYAHQRLGEVFRKRGQSELAMREFGFALDLFQQIRDPQGQAESFYWLAKISLEQGRLSEALVHSQKTIDIVEIQRARVIGQNWRSSYFASVRRYFELHVDILMQLDRQKPDQGFAALALAASERARARSLVELLTETQSEIRRDVDPALLARERQLRQQLSAMGAYEINTRNGTEGEAESANVELAIRNLNTEYDIVQAQIKAQSPAYAQLSKPSTLNLGEIQSDLKQDEDTILIEYLLGEERSYAWLVTPNALIARELPGRQALEDLARETYQSLTARQQQSNEDPAKYHQRYTTAEERFCPTSTQLSRVILGPFKSFLNKRRLLVVADGNLQYLPFDALPVPPENGAEQVCRLDAEPPNYAPLLTKLEIVHLPSFSLLSTLRQLSATSLRPPREVAVWADPVFESDDPRIVTYLRRPLIQQDRKPAIGTTQGSNSPLLVEPHVPPTRLLGTAEEAQGVMRFAPAGVSMLLTGFAANRESALAGDLQNYRILHFATHSLINNRHPSLTGLLLSTINERGQAQNGFLQLHDIYGLRLNADLVVLSGCQTGLGQELSGEGLIGLTQGFLYAGSRSVVVSLWDVQDKTTASLMSNFYQAMLQDGAAPADALHQAKLRMYKQNPSRPPFYWSAFVIQGEYRSPPKSWRQVVESRYLWSAVVLCGIVSWLISSWWKRRRHQNHSNRV